MGWFATLVYGNNVFRYHIVPIVLIVTFTLGVQAIAIWSQHHEFTFEEALVNLKGDAFSWSVFLAFCLWAYVSIYVRSSIHLGPETDFRFRPAYTNNGFCYYLLTLAVFDLIQWIFPTTSVTLYEKFPEIIGTCNTGGLLFCCWLYFKGKCWNEHLGDDPEEAPAPYEFYRGMELHPKFFGIDVKQLTNCRFGMMVWQILLLAFYIAFYQRNGFNVAITMHFALQTFYIAKFFYWEEGYFHTIDMMTDRAGYYLCWGCLTVIPALFCFPAALVINDPPTVSNYIAVIIGLTGLILSCIQLSVDQQKHEFRTAWREGQLYDIWGKPAKYILAEYSDHGRIKKSPLLISGYWGIVRHMNYTLELVICFCVSATLGFDHGLYTFTYFGLIAPIIIHRIVRDDTKCSKKYGKYWEMYKREVKYILIPGVI